MLEILFDKRNLIYGDYSVLLQLLDPPYLIIALGDYHDGPLINGTDTLFLSKDIYLAPVYNRNQLKEALKQGMRLRLPIVILSINRLFAISDFSTLNNILHAVLNRYDNVVYITTDVIKSRSYPPPPNAPHYIRHMVDVVIFVRKSKLSYVMYLIKHPFMPYTKFVWRDNFGEEYSLLPFISSVSGKGH